MVRTTRRLEALRYSRLEIDWKSALRLCPRRCVPVSTDASFVARRTASQLASSNEHRFAKSPAAFGHLAGKTPAPDRLREGAVLLFGGICRGRGVYRTEFARRCGPFTRRFDTRGRESA